MSEETAWTIIIGIGAIVILGIASLIAIHSYHVDKLFVEAGYHQCPDPRGGQMWCK